MNACRAAHALLLEIVEQLDKKPELLDSQEADQGSDTPKDGAP